MLFLLSVQFAGCVDYIIQVASRKFAIMMVFIILRYIEIHRTLTFVSISVFQNLLYQFNLFDDMSRSVRFDAGRKHVQSFHRLMITVQVELYHFHRFQLLQACFLCNLVFTFVGIVFQMAYVGNVTYIAYLITQMSEVTE